MTRQPPPRRKTDVSHLTVCDAVQKRLIADYDRLGTWQAVGAEIGVSGGTVCRVATSDYRPHNNAIRAALGLPALAPAPVCPRCGVVHTRQCKPETPAWVRQAAAWLAEKERR